MTTSVEEISGIGPQTAKILKEQGLGSAEAILKAGKSKLMAVPGFGASRAQSTLDAAKALLGSTKSSKASGKSAIKKKASQVKKETKKSKKDKKSKDKKKDKGKNKSKKKNKDSKSKKSKGNKKDKSKKAKK